MGSITTRVGDVMKGSLRPSMLANDRPLLPSMVADIAAMEAKALLEAALEAK